MRYFVAIDFRLLDEHTTNAQSVLTTCLSAGRPGIPKILKWQEEPRRTTVRSRLVTSPRA
jgi:hypothetical protein